MHQVPQVSLSLPPLLCFLPSTNLWCRRNVGDCLHASSTVDLETCKCVCPNPAVWNGDSCEVCTVTKYDCLYGSFFEKAQCKCKQCGADFAGVTAGKCNKCGFTCKNGATQDAGTCACSCAAGWQGKDCGEASCPALNGKMCNGHGSCVASGIAHCQCNGGWGGADCGGTNTNNGHCHSVGDPHPQNMDGCTFDWYNDGEIVFYKDVDGWEGALLYYYCHYFCPVRFCPVRFFIDLLCIC